MEELALSDEAVLSLGATDYAVIILMLILSGGIGLYFRFTGGRQKTTKEFLMAGKNMSVLPVSLSLSVTFLSSSTLLGHPADVYLYGSQIFLWSLGTIIGAAIASYFYLPVFFNINAKTAYEYLEKRFGKTTRNISSILFSLQIMLYIAVVLYGLSLALNAVTGISKWSFIIMMAFVCTFYCTLGGLKAVLWTDVFQCALMYTTVISVLVKGIMHVGGVKRSLDIARNGERIDFLNFSFNLAERYTFWNSTLNGVLLGIFLFGTSQVQVQRLLSVRSLKRAQLALYASIPLTAAFTAFCCWDGLVIYSLYHDCDPLLRPGNTLLTSPDQAFFLYNISFLWQPIFSTMSVIVVGYTCSYIIGYVRGWKYVEPEYISPVVRRWLFNFNTSTANENGIELFKITAKIEEEEEDEIDHTVESRNTEDAAQIFRY